MIAILVGLASFILYILFQAHGISTGDSGDLVTAAATFGVAHPPGYPLYTFLGWIVNHLPAYTVAWRLALLSSIPHAIVVGLVYSIVATLTQSRVSALFASVLLAGNYLFMLYSVTPEVFALLSLFLVGLAWLGLRLLSTKDIRYLYAMALVFGLALTHHHLILFFVPALIALLVRAVQVLRLQKTIVGILVRCGLLTLVGLLPYVYVVVAGHGASIINWDRPTNVANFIRLITRADYGTFVSSAAYGALPMQRLLQLKAMMEHMLLDFGAIGVVLLVIGLWYLWKRNRPWFAVVGLWIVVMGPLFLFYASFPLVNRFTLATFERFLLPMYSGIAIGIGFAHAWILTHVHAMGKRVAPELSKRGIVVMAFAALTFLYPFLMGYITLWKFQGLPQDMTAEHLGQDIFAAMPPESLVILGRDTVLFTGQYVRYATQYRADLIVLHASFIPSAEYRTTVLNIFPSLVYPSPEPKGAGFVPKFVVDNAATRAVFSNIQFALPEGWHWVPHGLVFRLTHVDDLPEVPALQEANDAIWNMLRSPDEGILSRYNHLMLSDVRDAYAAARMEYGKTLLRASEFESAKAQFEEAIRLDGDTQLSDAYVYRGITELSLKQCDAALSSFAQARATALSAGANLWLYEGVTYQDCVGDEQKAKELFSQYEEKKKVLEQPLGAQ